MPRRHPLLRRARDRLGQRGRLRLRPRRALHLCEPLTSKVVQRALARQLYQSGHVRTNPKITLCLAAGKIDGTATTVLLQKLLLRRGWKLIPPSELIAELRTCIDAKYENDVAFVVAKLLGRICT